VSRVHFLGQREGHRAGEAPDRVGAAVLHGLGALLGLLHERRVDRGLELGRDDEAAHHVQMRTARVLLV
jgi:hypothetical protein